MEEGLWIIPPFTEEAPTASSTDTGTAVEGGETGVSTGSDSVSTTGENTATSQEEGAASGRKIRKFRISGTVQLESWTDLFRSFVLPTSKMSLKQQKLGINFEMLAGDQSPIDPNDPAFKAMQEAARQLGLAFDEE